MDNYEQLQARLDALLKRQNQLARDIEDLRSDIAHHSSEEERANNNTDNFSASTISDARTSGIYPNALSGKQAEEKTGSQEVYTKRQNIFKSNIERFIGENLISKIGIIITIIGVAIGIKYSIEHDLISHLTRIIFGYLFGAALLALGLKLKKNYTNYSSVLVSGAIAIMYFITYASYAVYFVLPHALAFALMIAFTASAVYLAINYNRQVIAIIGLVGAYAIPFLLSGNNGNNLALLTYVAIINIGILTISIAKYWRLLFYTAFAATWIIYECWFGTEYFSPDSYPMSLYFLIIFFVIFYVTSLGYKFVHCKIFGSADISLMLTNTFVLFASGFYILDRHFSSDIATTIFLLSIATLYGATSAMVYKRKEADQNLFYLTAGLALLFVTIVIPVALDGSWVTLLWAGEALVLFAIGSIRGISKYKAISYPLMVLSFVSIFTEWELDNLSHPSPFFNDLFICTLLYVGMFAAISFLHYKYNKDSKTFIPQIIIAGILIASSFMLFYREIPHIQQSCTDSIVAQFDNLVSKNALTRQQKTLIHYQLSNVNTYGYIAKICYTMLFVCGMLYLNAAKVRNRMLGIFSLFAAIVALLLFLTSGLYELSSLHSYSFMYASNWRFAIRYLSIAIVALLAFCAYRQIQSQKDSGKSLLAFDLIAYTAAVWILSSEFLNISNFFDPANPYRIGLSILWGVCAFALVGIGIIQKKKHLRIGAFVLFAVTLIKLFAYDISHLSSLSKTIVLVLLGILLLGISFIYNKFKNEISEQ